MKASERPWSGDYVERCPLLYVMELIGSKWKLPILWCLNEEDGLHYNELKRRVHGVTNTILTKPSRWHFKCHYFFTGFCKSKECCKICSYS